VFHDWSKNLTNDLIQKQYAYNFAGTLKRPKMLQKIRNREMEARIKSDSTIK